MLRLLRISSEGTGYVYTNTRVRVMKSKLLSRDDFEKLMKMSIAEISRFLEEREYKKEFDELGRLLSGTNLIEYALNRNLEDQFSSILKFSVRNAKEELALYLKKFDIISIKTVLRGNISGIQDEIVANELITAGSLSKAFFKELLERTGNFEEVVEYLKNTEYYPILKKYRSDMPTLEDELDKYYYDTLLKSVSRNLLEFIKHEITSKNMAIEARAKKHKVVFKKMRGGKSYSEDLYDSPELRLKLRKDFVSRALKLISKFSHDITPVIAYFVAKENEVSNIRIIVRGKKAGLSEADMRHQLIIGE
ncbi:MAG: V-type ATPase subunit [Candidatus Aenigmarchaeota archaeon]|nr:V-type ATPase subunit [Candidatus Aenigmarchaeota archaeon]